MLADFLKLVQETAVKAQEVQEVDLSDPRKLGLAYNGTITTYLVPPHIRRHVLMGLDDFTDAVKKWNTESRSVVYHNPRNLMCVIDDDDRRDALEMPLEESQTFKLLREVGKKAFDHKQFVLLLKNHLWKHGAEALLPVVRRLEVVSGSRAAGEINQGRERGTREFQQDLANATEVPEYIDLMVYVYSNAGLRTTRTIRCSLDVELPNLVFRLAPLPDEIEIAQENAQMEIGKSLRDAVGDVPVFYGHP